MASPASKTGPSAQWRTVRRSRMSHRDITSSPRRSSAAPHQAARDQPQAPSQAHRRNIGGWHRSPDEAAAHQTHRLLRSRRSARISSPATGRVDCGDGPFACPSGASPFAPPVWTDWHDLVPGVDPRTDRPRPVRRLQLTSVPDDINVASYSRNRRHMFDLGMLNQSILGSVRRALAPLAPGPVETSSSRLHRWPRTTLPHSPPHTCLHGQKINLPCRKALSHLYSLGADARTRTGNRSITSRVRCQLRHAGEALIVVATDQG